MEELVPCFLNPEKAVTPSRPAHDRLLTAGRRWAPAARPQGVKRRENTWQGELGGPPRFNAQYGRWP
jgi:hypothetical protein